MGLVMTLLVRDEADINIDADSDVHRGYLLDLAASRTTASSSGHSEAIDVLEARSSRFENGIAERMPRRLRANVERLSRHVGSHG